jgi:hypothetical protein
MTSSYDFEKRKESKKKLIKASIVPVIDSRIE